MILAQAVLLILCIMESCLSRAIDITAKPERNFVKHLSANTISRRRACRVNIEQTVLRVIA